MAPNCCKVTSAVSVVPLFFLSVGLFVTVLGLGGWGIVVAQVANPCSNQINLTASCSPELVIGGVLNSTPETNLYNPNEYTYWLAGATSVGVLWAVCWTLTGVVIIALLHFGGLKAGTQDKKTGTSKPESIPLDEFGSQPENEPDSGIIEKTIVTIGGRHEKQEWVNKPLRMLNIGAAIGLFVSSLFFILALLCLLWGVGIAFDHTRRNDGRTVTPFVVVELLTAIVLPVFLFISGVFITAVLDFTTYGHADLRLQIPHFLPVVKFESGKNSKGIPHDYWVIEDTFYFELPKRTDRADHGFFYSFDKAPATWFLGAIVCLGIHLAISYFVDFTLDTQISLFENHMCDIIDTTYQCFHAGNLSEVNCEATNGTIHCFKFYRFGVDVDLISAVSQAFAFYLVATAVFARLFSVLKVILHIKPSKFWGIGFIVVAVLGVVGGVILLIFWVYGYADDKIEEILHFNIINMAQFFMVCSYILIIGLLLLISKWWERVDVDEHARPVTKQLVHYEDAERGEIESVAHEATASQPTSTDTKT